MIEHINVLMLEDSPADAELITRLLLKANLVFNFVLVTNKRGFIDALNRGDPSVILADNSLPQFNATEALEIVRARSLYIPFIMVTGTVSEEFAADIIKSGADDYILKDRMERLPSAIRNAIKHRKAEKESQEAIEEIQRSNERFITLSKATKDAVWDWNMLSNEVWWNSNFYALLGFRKGNVIPTLRECIKRIHPLDRNRVISMLIKMRNTSIPFMESEFRLQLTDGRFRIVQDRNYILKGTDGKAIRVIGVLVDITKQKNLEQELEVLSIVAKETINSVIIFEKETGLTSWINQGFTRHTGFTQKDIYGKNSLCILEGPDTDKLTVKFVQNQIQKNLPFTCDILIYTKKGAPKWEQASGQPILDAYGNVVKYFIIFNDISERKRNEEKLLESKIESQKDVTRIILQTQEMERNTLGRELHDNINQILASVSLRLGFYLEESENNIGVIENCLLILKKAIFETRKLSHHMVMPSFSQSSLKEELELLIDNYGFNQSVKLQLKDIKEKFIPSNIKETLFRIAQEQLSNISKHAKADKIAMQLSNDTNLVKMTIRDDGIGFNMHQKRKGIGITNIFARVVPYNGKVDFASVPGKGCTLSISIPLVPEMVSIQGT